MLKPMWQMLWPQGLSLFQFKFCDVIQNLIPHMRQMVFANILVEGWIIHPYVYSLFDQPHEVVILSPHHTEVVNCGVMTCDGVMVMRSI